MTPERGGAPPGDAVQAELDALWWTEADARLGAVAALTRRCVEGQDPPFARILAGMIARRRAWTLSRHDLKQIVDAVTAGRPTPPPRERDPELEHAIFHALHRIGPRAARAGALLPPRPPDLTAGDDRDLLWSALEFLWPTANIYADRAELDAVLSHVTPGQRAVFGVEWTLSEVNNGGFDQYFWNSTGIVWPDAVEGFRLVGLGDVSDLVKQAGERFPDGRPPADRAARQAAIEAIAGEGFGELDNAFYAGDHDGRIQAACAIHIRAHPGEFFRA